MCSRHQPLNGGYSEPYGLDPQEQALLADYVLRPYDVLMEARWEDHRIKVRIPSALGPRDAGNQARELHPGFVDLRADEVLPPTVVPDSATLPEWMTWAGIPMPDEPQP